MFKLILMYALASPLVLAVAHINLFLGLIVGIAIIGMLEGIEIH